MNFGQPDKIDPSFANRLATSGISGWKKVNIAAVGVNEDLIALLGGNVIVRWVINDSGSTGVINLKANGDTVFVPLPLTNGEMKIHLPHITHVSTTGSITSAIFGFQRLNQ